MSLIVGLAGTSSTREVTSAPVPTSTSGFSAVCVANSASVAV
nr:hypothetical protein [Haloarcula argentinensis]